MILGWSKDCDILKVEVMLSCMNQKDFSIIDRMKITTDVVVVNQCDHDGVKIFEKDGRRVVWCDSTERGVSKSRNMGLKYIRQEICLLADDDEIFFDDYEQKILDAFNGKENPDLVFFNLTTQNPKQKWYINPCIKRIHFFNIMRYGSPRAAFKKEKANGMRFDEKFGPGMFFYSGEDSLFFMGFLKRKMRVFANPACLATIDDGDSSWFEGYTDRYFMTKGAVFERMSHLYSILLILQYILRHQDETKGRGLLYSCKKMFEGRRMVREMDLGNK